MTTQELRELDGWIAEHVMGWKRVESVLQIFGKDQFATNSEFNEPPRVIIYEGYSRVQSWVPTERQGDAMDVLKKCAEKEMDNIVITNLEQWRVGIADWDSECVKNYHIAPTLELAICLFAKQLFSQTTK